MSKWFKYCVIPLLFLFKIEPAFAVKEDNVNEIARALVQSMTGAGNDPTLSRGSIGGIQLMMRIGGDTLESIFKYGILNYSQTGRTRGAKEPSMRRDQESGALSKGMHASIELDENPKGLHPKYGSLIITTKPPVKVRKYGNDQESQYGRYILFFKQNDKNFTDRVTFSIGDSLLENRIVPYYPLSNLKPLVEFQEGKRDFTTLLGRFIETQYWGTLSLKDVEKIYYEEDTQMSVETRSILKSISSYYKIPIYKILFEKPENNEFDSVSFTVEKDLELSLEGHASRLAIPFQDKKDELLDRYKYLEPIINGKPGQTFKEQRKYDNALADQELIVALLAENGDYTNLPPKLEDLVLQEIKRDQISLFKLSTNRNFPPSVRAAALHALIDEIWPHSWLTDKEYKEIITQLHDGAVLEILKHLKYRTADDFISALEPHMQEKPYKFDLSLVNYAYSSCMKRVSTSFSTGLAYLRFFFSNISKLWPYNVEPSPEMNLECESHRKQE